MINRELYDEMVRDYHELSDHADTLENDAGKALAHGESSDAAGRALLAISVRLEALGRLTLAGLTPPSYLSEHDDE